MPRFTFRFETLLKHRRREEERCQREVALQLRKQMVMRGELQNLQQEIVASRRSLGESLVGAVDLSRVGEFTRFSAQGTLRGRQLVQRLAQLEHLIAAARAALLEAVRRRKALEVLRERDYERWRRDESRREQAVLDEQAAQAWMRSGAEPGEVLA